MSLHEDGESPAPSTPPSKAPSLFGSLRVLSQAGGIMSQPFFKSDGGSASSPSLRPQYPASAPHLPERQTAPPSSPKAETTRLSFSSKFRRDHSGGLNQIFVEEHDDSHPRVLFGGKTGGPRLSLSSLGSPTRQAKKRKLVISGIPLNATRRLEAIQRWCQVRGVNCWYMVAPNFFSLDIASPLVKLIRSRGCPMVICTSTFRTRKLQIPYVRFSTNVPRISLFL